MKSIFMALWCFCFMLIAVIGCDQEMNIVMPVVEDVMDTDQKDEPDTEMPRSQPIAEVEQDAEMTEPAEPEPDDEVDPEPNVQTPPASDEETPVPTTDMTEETMEETDDPYQPLEGLIVSNGRVQFLFSSAGGCIQLKGTINGVRYTAHYSEWQRREDAESPWIDIPDTMNNSGLCAYSPTRSGQYRMVCEISIDGERGKYASENILEI